MPSSVPITKFAALSHCVDAIESNSLKLALSLCEKGLKKWHQSAQLKALRSLALWYAGREGLASEVAVEVAASQPTDFFTISIMDRVCQLQDNYARMVVLCENALGVGFDDRIAERLYFAYLRLNETKKLYSVHCVTVLSVALI